MVASSATFVPNPWPTHNVFWELVRKNLYVFLKFEARISKFETNTNHLNSNVPNVESTENSGILRGFEQRVLNLFRISIFGIRDFAPLKRTSYFLTPP